MRRPVRVLTVTGALAAAGVLAACDKPVPLVTVERGAFSTTITPSTYCFDAKHCRPSTKIDLPVVNARADDKVLVDVPKALADKGWAVAALSLDGAKALGGSGAIEHRHSYRIAASANNGEPFIVQVTQLREGKPDGSKWSFLVKITDTA
jgi:hypothetical protein